MGIIIFRSISLLRVKMETIEQRRAYFKAEGDVALQEWYGHLPNNCEMYELASLVVGRVVEYFVHPKPELESLYFSNVLISTKDFLDQLRSDLNPINPSLTHPNGGTFLYKKDYYLERADNTQSPESWLSLKIKNLCYSEFAVRDLLSKGKESVDNWPIEKLNYTCSLYFQKPWLHCAAIDRLLINAMIFQSVMEFCEYLTCFSLNRYTKEYEIRKRQRKNSHLIPFTFLIVFILGIGFASGYGWLTLAGIIILFAIKYTFNDFLPTPNSQAIEIDANAHLENLFRLFTLSHKIVSISYFREQLTIIDSRFTKVPDEIFSILDNASARGLVLLQDLL